MYISVSLSTAPNDRLGKIVEELDRSDADAIHIDICDASFFPSLIFCSKTVKDLRPYTKKPIDVHLAMINPTWIIDEVADAGANACAIQWDFCDFPRFTLDHIYRVGMKGGIALSPKNDIPDVTYARDRFDYIIVQTIEPAPSYHFIPYMAEKIKKNKPLEHNKGITWFMDGDITMSNLDSVIRSGVDSLVIGTFITGAPNIPDRVREIKDKIAEIQQKMQIENA
jgi:ribulose-phosphate 3-epimerase